jgi:polyhydroxyalkanoate synthase
VANQNANMGAGMFSPKLAPHHMAMVPPEKLAEIEKEYLEEVGKLWSNQEAVPFQDSRFKGLAWQDPISRFTANTYLVNARHLLKLADAVDADPKTQQRIRFATEQTVSAMSPSNFLATNPEALKQFMDTQGQSLTNGILNLLGDIRKGKVSQTDEAAFEVGKNMATSEGAIVFQNELFQLIQYKPLTAKVYERPFLMVPPCINKYYILDLQPENSVVRHLVSEGHTVFLVSWKNPDASMDHVTWDDYIGKGAIKAIEVTQAISKQEQINLLGFCVGGTIVSTALAVLAAKNEHPVASLTLLTALLDFEDTGILDVFIDEAMVQLREKTIGGDAGNFGLLSGVDLANTFSFLRPNDLVWNYVVDNYLKGNSPPPFDLLYWNGDSTNLPGPMYAWYLRHMYLQNELKIPGKLSVCGQKVDLGKIKCPVYIYASREDHIVPWWSAYASTKLLKGKLRFVLGASGHIAGVVNPPAKKKRNYWTNSQLPLAAQDWFKGAKEVAGSWWPDFTKWLGTHGGKQISAPKNYGSTQYKVIEQAPGSYVKEKAAKI